MKKVLAIAGSDCSGGAGIQADIKTITAHKLYALSVITALTAQNTTGVFGVLDVEPNFVKAQISACFDDITPDAVKIGMVSSAEIIEAIVNSLKMHGAKNIVFDPVMVATSGGVLLKPDALEAIKSQLCTLATVITPNLYEAQILSGQKISTPAEMRVACEKIAKFTDAAILVKGGHLEKNARDILFAGGEFFEFENPRIDTQNTHGTGCTLSSAIACGLAQDLSLQSAVKRAKDFVFTALSWKEKIGHGCGPIDHYFRIPEMNTYN